MALSADLHPDEIADGYERALVGGLLWDPERPLPPLLADEFFLERHRVIWTAMGELGILGVGHALPALTEHLRQRNQLQEAGGLEGLVALFDEGFFHSLYVDDIDADTADHKGYIEEVIIESRVWRLSEDGTQKHQWTNGKQQIRTKGFQCGSVFKEPKVPVR